MRLWLSPSAFFPHRGGVEELTLKTGQHLRGLGHDVVVVTNRWPLGLPTHDEVEGLPVVRVPFTLPGRDPRSWAGHLRATRHARTVLEGLAPPDLVHVQCPSSQTPHVTAHAGRLGVPLVLTTQGETYMDAGRLYQRSAAARRALRRGAAAARVLTACSQHAADGAGRIAPRFSSARIVPNGVDPDDWAGASTVHEPVVVAWGRHVPQKGLDLLVEAFPLVRDEVPGARLLVGGDGPETPRLRSLAGDGVELVGPLDRAGVRALLAQARVAVVPSRVEPFGIVALEALASGRGLVWSRHGGLVEAAGPLGRGVDPLDRSALAAAVVDELATPTPAAAGQARGGEHAWDRITERYLQVYDEALSQG